MNEKYYQTLDNGNQVLDFKKISKYNHRINVIMSERGAQGKTFNIKEYALHLWESKKWKTVWVVNSQTQVDMSKTRFTTSNEKYNKRWKNYDVDSTGVYIRSEEGKPILTTQRKYIIYFAAIINANKHKTSRDDNVKLIVYDEFNEYIVPVWDLQIPMFENLLNTYQIPQHPNSKTQIYLFGNQKGVAVPILKQLGFDKLEGEETERTYSDNLSCWMYVPTKSKEAQAKMEKHWLYQFSKIMGMVDQSFLNKPTEENLDGVIEIPKENRDFWLGERGFRFVQTYFIHYGYYKLLHSSTYNAYLFMETRNEKKPTLYINEGDREVGYIFDRLYHAKINALLACENIFFDSIFTKYSIVKTLKSRA